MSEMFRVMLATLGSLLVLTPLQGAAQRPPDFSGDWVLASATTTGGRATAQSGKSEAGPTPIRSNAVSGAPLNCGRECRIVHKGQMLTIEKAFLASRQTSAPAVVLQIDGRQRSVVDAFSPSREIPVTAKWNGAKLEVSGSTGAHTITQSVSVEGTELVVITSVNIDSASPVTFRYKKKK